jgi:Arc/MetJ-type ribon-helix-helix transcriptional regulator
MSSKVRLTVTVDPELVARAEAAVGAGRAKSVSAWMNEAMRALADRDAQLDALAIAIERYEAEHGVITEQEIAVARREAAQRTTEVAPRRSRAKPSKRGVA